MDVPWKVLFAFVGVFIAGAVFGGVFTVGVSARRDANSRRAERPLNQIPPKKEKVFVAGPKAPGAEVVQARGNSITPTLMREFTRRLRPTEEQQAEFRKILGRAGEDMHRLRQQNFADVARATERMYADIAGILSPEQKSELEKMRLQQEERMQSDRKKRAEAAAAEAQTRLNASPASVRPNPSNP